MVKRIIVISFVILITASALSLSFAQRRSLHNKRNFIKRNTVVFTIFKEIENSFSKSDIGKIARKLSGQTYLNLMDKINGYYSSNQAYYVLKEFFENYHIVRFKFQNIVTDNNNPYATGKYIYVHRRKQDIARVYIAIKLVGHFWKITQITIN